MKKITEIKWDRYGNPIILPEEDELSQSSQSKGLLKRIISIFVLWK